MNDETIRFVNKTKKKKNLILAITLLENNQLVTNQSSNILQKVNTDERERYFFVLFSSINNIEHFKNGINQIMSEFITIIYVLNKKSITHTGLFGEVLKHFIHSNTNRLTSLDTNLAKSTNSFSSCL